MGKMVNARAYFQEINRDDLFDQIDRTEQSGNFMEEVFSGQYPKNINQATDQVEYYFMHEIGLDRYRLESPYIDILFVFKELFTVAMYEKELAKFSKSMEYYGRGESLRLLNSTADKLEENRRRLNTVVNNTPQQWRTNPCFALVFETRHNGEPKEFWGAGEALPKNVLKIIGVFD